MGLNKKHMKEKFDVGGIFASLICLIHCIAFPLLANTAMFFSVKLIHNIWIDIVLLFVSAYLGIGVLIPSYKNIHHKILPLGLFLIGIVLLSLKQIAELTSYAYNIKLYYVFTTIALCSIIASHVLNIWYRQQHKKQCSSSCTHQL